jgi:putrescine transport system substrate-binding protein
MWRLATWVVLSFLLVSPNLWATTLYIYNWSEYFAPETLPEFRQETGINTVYDVYDSNEMLEAKLYAGNMGYDVVFPTNYPYFYRQQQAGVYRPLDADLLSNLGNVAPVFLEPLYIDDELYGVPYMWGTVGYGYNKEKVTALLGDDAPLDSWAIAFEPEYLQKLKSCKVAFMDSPVYLMPILLNYMGLDPNSKDLADYQQAFAKLAELRPYITYFHDAQYLNDLANGNICFAIGWSGDLVMARDRAKESKQKFTIEYVNPKEGSLFLYDIMAIPKGAKNYEAALRFINYIIEPKVMAQITNYIGYPNPVPSATEYLDESVAADPAVYPPESVTEHFFVPEELPLSLEKNINRNWAKMKATR